MGVSMQKIILCFIAIFLFPVCAFASQQFSSEKISLDEGETKYITLIPGEKIGITLKKDKIFAIRDGDRYFLEEIRHSIRPTEVVAFTYPDNNSLYFFIHVSMGASGLSAGHVLVDDYGRESGPALFGEETSDYCNAHINAKDKTLRSSFNLPHNLFTLADYKKEYSFTPEGINIKETHFVGELSYITTWKAHSAYEKTITKEGKSFEATLGDGRDKIYLSSEPAKGKETKSYLLDGDKVLVTDIFEDWAKVLHKKSNTSGWINGYHIVMNPED